MKNPSPTKSIQDMKVQANKQTINLMKSKAPKKVAGKKNLQKSNFESFEAESLTPNSE